MADGIIEVRGLVKRRLVMLLVVGVPLIVVVTAASSQPGAVAERAGIGAAIWAVFQGVAGLLRPGSYTVRRLPNERLPPKRSGWGVLAAEALFAVALYVWFGIWEAHSLAHPHSAGLIAAWALGVPLGQAFGAIVELGAWARISRRERGSLWMSYSLTAGRSARRRGVFVVPDIGVSHTAG